MKKKLVMLSLFVAMLVTTIMVFNVLEGDDDIFAVSFDEDEDADF